MTINNFYKFYYSRLGSEAVRVLPFSNHFLLTPVRKQKLISFYINSFSHLPVKDDVFIDFSIIILYRDILISTPGCDICYHCQLHMFSFLMIALLLIVCLAWIIQTRYIYILGLRILGLSFKSLSTLNFHVFEYSAINLFMILLWICISSEYESLNNFYIVIAIVGSLNHLFNKRYIPSMCQVLDWWSLANLILMIEKIFF